MIGKNINLLFNRVFLIGFMGVGKSTLGRILAQKLGYAFLDLDLYIEEKLGMRVCEIFQTHGEAFFRGKESEALTQIIQEKDHVVVALGGGAFLRDSFRQVVNSHGVSIYLKASVGTLCSRLLQDNLEQRPLLRGLDQQRLKFQVEELLEKRLQAYGEASFFVDTDDQGPQELACKIVELIQAQH
ncbi:shikimate kinase [bacterium]|jgi:shikimate kinase|nr:shikimate kinase [bacterium]